MLAPKKMSSRTEWIHNTFQQATPLIPDLVNLVSEYVSLYKDGFYQCHRFVVLREPSPRDVFKNVRAFGYFEFAISKPYPSLVVYDGQSYGGGFHEKEYVEDACPDLIYPKPVRRPDDPCIYEDCDADDHRVCVANEFNYTDHRRIPRPKYVLNFCHDPLYRPSPSEAKEAEQNLTDFIKGDVNEIRLYDEDGYEEVNLKTPELVHHKSLRKPLDCLDTRFYNFKEVLEPYICDEAGSHRFERPEFTRFHIMYLDYADIVQTRAFQYRNKRWGEDSLHGSRVFINEVESWRAEAKLLTYL